MDLANMPFGNGAGSIKSLEDVQRACRGPMTRITVGSITAKPRAGNIGEIYYFHPQDRWSLNTLGLPNHGMDAYLDLLPTMVAMAHKEKKELWASVAGFSPDEYADMAANCFLAGVDGVELNLSCPNVWEGSAHAAIPALEPDLMDKILGVVRLQSQDPRIAVKLSPTDDDTLMERIAQIVSYRRIGWVTACNTIPNQQRVRVDGKEALAFRSNEQDGVIKHVGGLAGTACFEQNLYVVRKMRLLLPRDVKIMGCGGIFNGADADQYLRAGAEGFQCTTSYLEFKERMFVDILFLLDDLNSHS